MQHNNTQPRAHTFIRHIEPYQPGRTLDELARELGMPSDKIVRLAANENPYGMGPAAREALKNIQAGSRYPDVSMLQKSIAQRLGVDPEMVIPGNGSCEVLELIARAFLSPQRSAVYPLYSFVMYKLATQYMGATGVAVPPGTDHADNLPGMLAAISPDTHVLWFSNVNNPIGSFTPYTEIKNFVQHIPPHVIVVLDEAYHEYLPDKEREDTLSWLHQFPNLIITRTFSKIHGLAGMRIGYGLAPPHLAQNINRMRGPYNCNTLGISAALAALDDVDYMRTSRERNRVGRQQLQDGLAKRGFLCLPAWGNFVTVEVQDAFATYQKLLSQGIVVLPLNGYGLPNHIRVSVGRPHEIEAFLGAFGNL